MADSSNKASLLAVGAVGIVGTLLGMAGTFFFSHQAKPDHKFAMADNNVHARITLNNDGTCTQRVKGIRYKFPVVPSSSQIDWQGQDGRNGHGGAAASIDVQFDSQNSPFSSNDFQSADGSPTSPSGLPVRGPDDYSFTSVSVGGVACRFTDPGVHVDQ